MYVLEFNGKLEPQCEIANMLLDFIQHAKSTAASMAGGDEPPRVTLTNWCGKEWDMVTLEDLQGIKWLSGMYYTGDSGGPWPYEGFAFGLYHKKYGRPATFCFSNCDFYQEAQDLKDMVLEQAYGESIVTGDDGKNTIISMGPVGLHTDIFSFNVLGHSFIIKSLRCRIRRGN